MAGQTVFGRLGTGALAFTCGFSITVMIPAELDSRVVVIGCGRGGSDTAVRRTAKSGR